jgi:UDP-N-acetylglucosamine:LPS N-acetylglucosamine transferase
MNKNNLCIFFSDTGGGHRSAAEAVAGGIAELTTSHQAQNVPEVHLENIAEQSHPINRGFVEIYNYLLRHHQPLMKYYNWFVEQAKPNDSDMAYQLCRPYLYKLLGHYEPSVVVSVHPMINHYVARTIREMELQTKLVVVVTDPNKVLWKGWACHDADLTIAPNDLAFETLLKQGMDPKKVATIGMPIHPDFLRPPSVSREDFLTSLGLKPNLLTVAINSGWAGSKKLMRVYTSLSQAGQPVQCIFLAGHNQELFERVKQQVKTSPVPTAVLPFHDNMAELMSSCDLMVTKAGGLTTYEALARRLPMALDLLTEPMPQERGTADLMIEEKLAAPLYSPEDIIPVVRKMQPGRDEQRLVLPPEHELNRVDAVYDIARQILQLCDGVSLKSSAYSSENQL